ncbi:MAG: MBL fold metallo-hydrolase [Promethearchaeota archaeon]|nr:MAG: MBL fold metallo-hydrolase [Candidatus Lokiarchaeota archaeon]
MIFERLMVGPLGTNCYLFGSEKTREIVIIDPGGDATKIINVIKDLNAKPIAVLLTHGHFDHTLKVGRLLKHFQIPLMFNKKEFDSRIYTGVQADRWLQEGDTISIGEITLKTLETPGHSPGSLCFYTDDVKSFNNRDIDGILFSGDLLFQGSIGRSDIGGGNQTRLFQSIKEKIMYNEQLSDDFVVFPGHMGPTTIGEERSTNMFRRYFL